jgi:hypothetical protein
MLIVGYLKLKAEKEGIWQEQGALLEKAFKCKWSLHKPLTFPLENSDFFTHRVR